MANRIHPTLSFVDLEERYLRSDGLNKVRNPLDMNFFKFINLKEPVNPHDAATKYYTRTNALKSGRILTNLDMTNHYVKNLKNPEDNYDSMSKQYIQDRYNPIKRGTVITTNLDMNNHEIFSTSLIANLALLTLSKIKLAELCVEQNKSNTFSGSMHMKNYPINALPEPVQKTDLATLKYARDSAHGLLKKTGTLQLTGDLNMSDNEITNISSDPSSNAASKKYVDDLFKVSQSLTIPTNGPLDMKNNRIVGLTYAPASDDSIVHKKFFDDNTLLKSGGTISVPLTNSLKKNIYNVKYPTNNNDAATKAYVDSVVLNHTNTKTISQINMGGKRIYKLSNTPQNDKDGVSKAYIDKGTKTSRDARNHAKKASHLPNYGDLTLGLVPSVHSCQIDGRNINYIMDSSINSYIFVPKTNQPKLRTDVKGNDYIDFNFNTLESTVEYNNLKNRQNNGSTIFLLSKNQQTTNTMLDIKDVLTITQTRINSYASTLKIVINNSTSQQYEIPIYHTNTDYDLITILFHETTKTNQTFSVYYGTKNYKIFEVDTRRPVVSNGQLLSLAHPNSENHLYSLLMYKRAFDIVNLKHIWKYYSQTYDI